MASMAKSTGHQGIYLPADPEGAALEPVAIQPMPASKSEDEPSSIDPEKLPLPDVTRVTTQNTVTSALTVESKTFDPKVGRPWYKYLNPLTYGATIPVPKERSISREYNANFLSLLTFQWMAPIMKASAIF